MSFLQKFKGKTTQITKQGVDNLLGRANSQTKNDPFKTYDIPMTTAPHTTILKTKKNSTSTHTEQSPSPTRLIKVNPFSVLNPLYLDESERQRDEKMRKQKELKERLQRERRKRKQIEERMAQFQQANKQKFSRKEWIKLGGLGPNIGGEQWSQKKEMQQKMKKFASEIKQINFNKIKCVPFMSYSHISKESRRDARSKALQYSRTVPRPLLLAGQQSLLQSPKPTHSRKELSELQMLDISHEKYIDLVRRI